MELRTGTLGISCALSLFIGIGIGNYFTKQNGINPFDEPIAVVRTNTATRIEELVMKDGGGNEIICLRQENDYFTLDSIKKQKKEEIESEYINKLKFSSYWI